SRRRHTRFSRDWSSDVCSSDLGADAAARPVGQGIARLRTAAPGIPQTDGHRLRLRRGPDAAAHDIAARTGYQGDEAGLRWSMARDRKSVVEGEGVDARAGACT